MKLIVLLIFLTSVLSLGSALTSMTKKSGKPGAVANALMIRVALSAGLVILLLVGYTLGWIEPGGS